MRSSEIVSLLDDQTRETLGCVVEIGLRQWQPGGVHTTKNDDLVELFYVLDGILACEQSTHTTDVLPRELLRVGCSDERVLENPSRSDTTTAIQLSLKPDDDSALSTRHHYFSDDQKDNKLCRVAAFERDGRTLATRASVDIFITTLGRYDTLLLSREANQPMLIVCVRGKVTLNTVPMTACSPAQPVTDDTATIVGVHPSTILTIRGNDSTTRA